MLPIATRNFLATVDFETGRLCTPVANLGQPPFRFEVKTRVVNVARIRISAPSGDNLPRHLPVARLRGVHVQYRPASRQAAQKE